MTPAELRELVSTMRELGVLEANGVKLGPEPLRAQNLERAIAEEKDPIAKAALTLEREKDKRETALKAWRDEVRAKLGDMTESIPVERLDYLCPPPIDLVQ